VGYNAKNLEALRTILLVRICESGSGMSRLDDYHDFVEQNLAAKYSCRRQNSLLVVHPMFYSSPAGTGTSASTPAKVSTLRQFSRLAAKRRLWSSRRSNTLSAMNRTEQP